MRYYLTERFATPGAIPAGDNVRAVVNFAAKTYVEEIDRAAYAYIETTNPLSDEDIEAFELTPVLPKEELYNRIYSSYGWRVGDEGAGIVLFKDMADGERIYIPVMDVKNPRAEIAECVKQYNPDEEALQQYNLSAGAGGSKGLDKFLAEKRQNKQDMVDLALAIMETE